MIGRHLAVLFLLYSLPVDSSFKFQDCGDEESIVQLSVFSVSPDPVDLTQRHVNISARGTISRDMPDSAWLDVRYYKTRRVFGIQLDIPIPCFLGKHGSCSLPFCEYLDRFRSAACPFFAGSDCECPPKKGSYGADDVPVQMAHTSTVGRMIAKGTYRIVVRLTEGAIGKELACLQFYMELV